MKKNRNIIILIVVVLVFGVVLYSVVNINKTLPSQSNIINNKQQAKTFRSSSAMKLSITLPATYIVEEKFAKVTILAPEGEIYINHIGTSYDNLEDLLGNVKERNKFSIKEEKKLVINGLLATLWEKTDERLYILYQENTVYTISTKFKSLYTALDQIAQSFRYAP